MYSPFMILHDEKKYIINNIYYYVIYFIYDNRFLLL